MNCQLCGRDVSPEYIRQRSCVHCQGNRNRDQVDRMQGLIRELKANPQSDHRSQIIRDIESIGHPDLPGLLKAIDEKASAPAPRKQRYA